MRPAVVADGRGGMKARGGEPGHGATEAIADDADFFVRRGGSIVDSRGNVEDRFVDIEFWEKAHCGLHAGRIVAKIDAGLNAVEKRGGDSEKAVACPAIGDGADVGVDAEDFLKNDEAGDWLGHWMGDVGVEGVAVGGSQGY